MRFPWLQVDSDFISSRASELGALLGISRREALGLALDLWAWVLSRSPADRPPDGILSGSAPVPVLASAVSWPDPERLVSALVEVGLVERIPEGLRIKGLDRYRATWEKNRRRPGRNRTGTEPEPPPVPARKTQTQTQKKQSPTETAGGAEAPARQQQDAERHLPGLEPPPPAPEESKPSRADHEWARWANAERDKVKPPTAPAEAGLKKHQWAALGTALKDHGRKLLESAFLLYLADGYARGQGFPLGLFVAQWAEWVAKAQAADAASRGGGSVTALPARAPVRAESQPGYDPEKPAVTVRSGREAFGR